jgi:hypothetical protein
LHHCAFEKQPADARLFFFTASLKPAAQRYCFLFFVEAAFLLPGSVVFHSAAHSLYFEYGSLALLIPKRLLPAKAPAVSWVGWGCAKNFN